MSHPQSPKLTELLALRSAERVRNSTTELILSHLRGRYEQVLAAIPSWETVELWVPVRDAEGRYKRDADGLAVTELKRISKQAQAAMPILDALEAQEQQYIDWLETYVDESTSKRDAAEVNAQLTDEGLLPFNRDDLQELEARHAELMAVCRERNRATVAAKLATARAKRAAPVEAPAAASKAKATKAAA